MASDMPAEISLTVRLARASRKIHSVSDALVNARLFALFTDRQLYGKALACFYYVFTALEAALDHALQRGVPDITHFQDILPGLYRNAGFRQDCEYFLGKDWEAKCPKSEALKEYERHLTELGRTSPRLLLAHVFTQHLAVAAGGQVIKRMARKHLRLPEGQGTAAFEYTGDSSNTLRSRLKSRLDAWSGGLGEEEVQQLVSEHIAAFRHNNAIIRAFRLPALAALRGLLRVAPPRLLLLLLALAAAAVAALVAAWRAGAAAVARRGGA